MIDAQKILKEVDELVPFQIRIDHELYYRGDVEYIDADHAMKVIYKNYYTFKAYTFLFFSTDDLYAQIKANKGEIIKKD